LGQVAVVVVAAVAQLEEEGARLVVAVVEMWVGLP